MFLGAMALAIIGAVILGFIVTSPKPSPVPPHTGFPPAVLLKTEAHVLQPVRGPRTEAWRLPHVLSGPRDVLIGPDGAVWVTEQNTSAVDAFRGTTLTRYLAGVVFSDVGTFGLANGPDGAIWYSGYPGGSLGRILPDGSGNSFEGLAQGSATVGIAQAPDGAMWSTDANLGVLVRIGPDGAVGAYTPPGLGGRRAQPYGIVAGGDRAMWFTDPANGSIGRATTDGSSIVEHPVSDPRSQPRSIVAAQDGTLWVTLAKGRALAHIDPATWPQADVIPLRAATANLTDVAVAADGTLWVTEEGADVLHVRPDGSLIERVRLPLGATYADGVAVAPDGSVWVAASDANLLVRIPPPS